MITSMFPGGKGGKDISGATVVLGAALTYNGNLQTQAVTSVTVNGVILAANTDYVVVNNLATNAGTHTLTVLGVQNYTGAKDIQFTIAKAQGSISVNPSTLEIVGAGQTETSTINKIGDGVVNVSSGDTDVATASISGNTVTATVTGTGTTNIIVTMANGANYLGAECIITVEARAYNIYGAEWDGTSTTAWSRTDDAANFTDPVPYVAGATNYSSPFDNIMPWSGMVRVTDAAAGELVAIPKFWYKWTRSGTSMKLQIATVAVEGFFVSPAHMDREDGNGERDVVYVGRYHCASTYKSTTGLTPQVGISRDTARTNIHNLGSDIWQIDYSMLWTIRMLYLVEFADWDSQSKIGYGCGNNSYKEYMGKSDIMPYHTGIMQSSRTTYDVGCQYRYIEDLWGNVYDWCDGIRMSGSDIYVFLNPANYMDGQGGMLAGTRILSNGYTSAWNFPTATNFEWALYSSAVSGSSSTYVCDTCINDGGYRGLYFGGAFGDNDLKCGMFYMVTNNLVSNGYIGARLQKLP